MLWTTILVLVFSPTISCLPSLLPVLIILFVVIYPLEIDPCWIRILKRKICHTQQINCDGLKMEAFSRWLSGKESACQCRRCKRPGFNPWVGKIPQRRIWQPTPVYPCVENPMDRRAWWATFREVTKSQTWLSVHTHTKIKLFIKIQRETRSTRAG